MIGPNVRWTKIPWSKSQTLLWVLLEGRVGDCWLIAAIAAVAEFPYYLEDYVFQRKETTSGDVFFEAEMVEINCGWDNFGEKSIGWIVKWEGETGPILFLWMNLVAMGDQSKSDGGKELAEDGRYELRTSSCWKFQWFWLKISST